MTLKIFNIYEVSDCAVEFKWIIIDRDCQGYSLSWISQYFSTKDHKGLLFYNLNSGNQEHPNHTWMQVKLYNPAPGKCVFWTLEIQ